MGIKITASSQRKSRQELKQGRKLEAGTEAETVQECCLLAFSPGFYLLSLLSSTNQGLQGCYHPEWAGPPHSDH